MLHELKAIADRVSGADAETIEDDLREAACALEQRQFIYAYERGGRRRFELVRRHWQYFVALFDAFGKDLRFHEAEQMIGVFARPGTASVSNMSKPESLFLVGLKAAHDEKRDAKEIDETGCCETTLDHVWTLVESHSGAKRPGITASRDLMRAFKKRGLLTDGEEHGDDVAITIRPAIRIVASNASAGSIERIAGARSTTEGTLPEEEAA